MNGSDSYRDSRHGYSSSRRDRDRDGHRDRDRERGDRHGGDGADYHSRHGERGEGRERGDRGERGDRRDRGDRGDREYRGDRRRSRSPHAPREGGRGARGAPPAAAAAADDYYSSRDLRDREREREHARGERDIGRDRRDRDRRGDDDRRRGGRDRDGGRGDRRERREDVNMGGMDEARQPRRSPSPPKVKEPTPDLTDIIPVNERKRRLTMWDIKPPGYESVTAEQAKLSGMFPLPGAPRQTALDPSRMAAFVNHPPKEGSTPQPTALKPSNSRQAKRLLCQNLPPMCTEETIYSFFSGFLKSLNAVDSENEPLITVYLNPTSTMAMLEFRSTAYATLCLAFDGMEFDDTEVKIRLSRPKDYIIPQYSESSESHNGDISPNVPDSINKICVSNIPTHLADQQVMELLQTFGPLKSFFLVKDKEMDESKGVAFCEYLDPNIAEIAIEGLNGLDINEQLLNVKRASIGVKQSAGAEAGIPAMTVIAATTSAEMEGGRVLQLLNMVTADELLDQEEYEEILEDVTDECNKFGPIIDIKIPRPSGNQRAAAGVGKIYVRFEEHESAEKALKSLAGRKFADRTVIVSYFSEENYDVGAW
ncbi:hypothetical protein TWF106_010981 [Orbilia oligospora]|uniref:Splicing factor U2AF subunit n=2 Tax=Orbilia oligospora TaxID=2813651 RepID=A0A6G1ME38_ORBOL|nr:hypothetical protein TWF788_010620 [Orbilia oligospora]KAF3209404.1 hypothetical protein TWF106_010981 [Orbilia oligospora]KAF3210701.1 hypothetical protein TWF191_011084 [Orbilia oligospora]KAF3215434.1 hypothetical protein TWF679_003956 [Orbilia oligospora]KAF3255283.1 hypothetical protein TWF192_002643 [Orbilia oligospora]